MYHPRDEWTSAPFVLATLRFASAAVELPPLLRFRHINDGLSTIRITFIAWCLDEFNAGTCSAGHGGFLSCADDQEGGDHNYTADEQGYGGVTHDGADGQAGDARALAFSGQEPMPSLPDVPTLKELGYDIDVSTPRGLVVAPGVDRGVQQWWIDTMKKVMKLSEWREYLKQNDLNEKVLYGEDFTEYFRETQTS
jgi:hypothetical protein